MGFERLRSVMGVYVDCGGCVGLLGSRGSEGELPFEGLCRVADAGGELWGIVFFAVSFGLKCKLRRCHPNRPRSSAFQGLGPPMKSA